MHCLAFCFVFANQSSTCPSQFQQWALVHCISYVQLICSWFYCKLDNSRFCYTRRLPAMDGTSCGTNKVSYINRCQWFYWTRTCWKEYATDFIVVWLNTKHYSRFRVFIQPRLHIALCNHSRDFSIRTAEAYAWLRHQNSRETPPFQYFYHVSDRRVQCAIGTKNPETTVLHHSSYCTYAYISPPKNHHHTVQVARV